VKVFRPKERRIIANFQEFGFLGRYHKSWEHPDFEKFIDYRLFFYFSGL